MNPCTAQTTRYMNTPANKAARPSSSARADHRVAWTQSCALTANSVGGSAWKNGAEISRSSCGSTAKTTPTATAMTSVMTRPARFMASLPCPRFAAGEQPINQPAGNARGGEHLTLAHEIAARRADITGEIEAVGHNERQHAAKRAIDDDRAQGKAFRQRDQQQCRQYG